MQSKGRQAQAWAAGGSSTTLNVCTRTPGGPSRGGVLCPQRHQRGSGRWWATCCCDGGVWRCWERAGGRALDDSRQRLRATSQSARCTDAGLSAGPSGLATSLHTQASASAHRHKSLHLACAKSQRCSCKDDEWRWPWQASLPEQRSAAQRPTVSPARLYPGLLLLLCGETLDQCWQHCRRSTGTLGEAAKMPLNALISPK